MNIQSKPVKYAHYNAWLYVYENCCELRARFRYHDPLPEGTVLRLTALDGVSGSYGEALIVSAGMENQSILYAQIPLELPGEATAFTVAAYAPGSDEAIFEVTLGTSTPATGYWNGGTWYSPSGEVYQPLATPQPGQFGQYGDSSILGP